MISNNKANWVPQGYLGTEFSPVWGEILTFGLPDIGLFVFFILQSYTVMYQSLIHILPSVIKK